MLLPKLGHLVISLASLHFHIMQHLTFTLLLPVIQIKINMNFFQSPGICWTVLSIITNKKTFGVQNQLKLSGIQRTKQILETIGLKEQKHHWIVVMTKKKKKKMKKEYQEMTIKMRFLW